MRIQFKYVIIVTFSLLFFNGASGQKLKFNGYLKDLRTIDVTTFDSVPIQNLIHNRLNLKYKLHRNLKMVMEIRNRMFYGEFTTDVGKFTDRLDEQNDFFNLSITPIEKNNLLLHCMLDRSYLSYQNGNLEIKLGRQRINWGLNLFWNPNDLFNAYSFYDFDYEERPGSDALLVRYYTGVASNIDAAIKIADNFEYSTFAALWKINKWDYDMQFIAGKVEKDYVLGLGWAGNLKNAGFKGEGTYYRSTKEKGEEEELESKNTYVFSMSSSYSVSEKFFINGEFLYNSTGNSSITEKEFNDYLNSILNSKNLSPTKFSLAIQPIFNFNPKYSLILNSVFYLGENAIYLNPSLSSNLTDNFSLSLIGQLIASEITGKYEINNASLSVRFKWHF